MVPRFTTGPVTVTVPATSANLGPGYDAVGLALDVRDTLTGSVSETGLHIEVSGAGADDVSRDDTNLVVRAMAAGFDAMAVPMPGLRLRCRNRIPHGRGLGSSSAAIVGGLWLARALVADGTARFDDAALFEVAADLEGHPDNVAPAVFGGFVIAGRDGARWFAAGSPVDERLSVVAFVPPTPVRTVVARGLLPDVITHDDAAANSGRAALLVAALAGRPEHLLLATHDFLHEAFREPAMPDSLALVRSLRVDRIPAVVSGAGPTVLAFVVPGGTGTERLVARRPPGWAAWPLAVDRQGATIA